MVTGRIGAHAVVLGASMAGLLAARVLSTAYDRVTIVDRDEFPDDATVRGGVPQGRHAHGLLAGGREVLEELFPGLVKDLVAAGSPSGDVLSRGRYYFGGHRLARHDSHMVALGASRPLLELFVRQRVLAIPTVTLIQRTDVVDLVLDAGGIQVTGVEVVRRGGDRVAQSIDADLVVDSSGRGSRTPEWLFRRGYPQVGTDRVGIDLAYTSRVFRLDPDGLDGDLVMLLASTPANPRGAVLQLLEGDRALLSLIGILGDYPPIDDAGFRAFASSLAVPEIYAAVRDAEPVGPAASFRFPESIRRRYERMSRFPTGLLVLGDALCSFNPAYAQGMSVSALEALVLRDTLNWACIRREQPDAQRFFRAAAKVVDQPWMVAAGGDLAFPGVKGDRSAAVAVVNAYMARLLAAAERDAALAVAFVRVAALLDPPPALMRPDRLLRVFVLAPFRRRWHR
jgi:2-polyprenyl-6-methoxyphenol hydroxylase-like FAD-dependent oxidoreductase